MQFAHSKSAQSKSDCNILQFEVIFGHVYMVQKFSMDVLPYMSLI